MRKLLYLKLAAQNIRKNRRFYFPYLITGIFTVSMFYNMMFLTTSKDISSMPGGDELPLILGLGSVVVGIFAFVFLLYTNSFLMKRRQKEIGLYNILGMGKIHIAKILFWETVYTCFITIAGGLIFGMLVSKLLLLLLFKLLFFDVHFGFSVSAAALGFTALLFAIVYFIALLGNLLRLKISKPIELLHGNNVGEKEPKTKWILAVIGVITLGLGYYIAITTENPLEAILLFFVAVILVIIGTYCLFTAGSIALLKILRKNKKFYYKTKNFTAVSGMLYRMKQNAVGLANICILSTMVLVMISTSVCMYVGVDDALENRFQRDIDFNINTETYGDYIKPTKEKVFEQVEKAGLNVKNSYEYKSLTFMVFVDGSNFTVNNDEVDYTDGGYLGVITQEEYKKLTGTALNLENGNVAAFCRLKSTDWESINLLGKDYKISKWLDTFPIEGDYAEDIFKGYWIVVSDDATLNEIMEAQRISYDGAESNIRWHFAFDLDGTDEQIKACYNNIVEATKIPCEYQTDDGNGNIKTVKSFMSFSECKQDFRESFYAAYGCLLFLGIFLGTLFLMATVLIIYYKQISEGYEDKERFEIMQKVGMSKSEVKKSIRRQVLIVFFLPLIMAFIHIAAAFKMITRLMLVFSLTETGLFMICTIVTLLIFGICYGIVYALTSKAYYSIISSSSK